MHTWLAAGIGAAVGAINGSSILFVRRERYKAEILAATTLRTALVALLAGYALGPASGWWAGLGYGVWYGFLTAVVVFLAKGTSKHAPLLFFGSLTGAITGLLVWRFAIG